MPDIQRVPLKMSHISLDIGQRGIILGMTRVGKSTLAEQLIAGWRAKYPQARTIILDSKPRFKAEHELDGRTTNMSKRYRQWDHGAFVPGSVVLPLKNIASEVKMAWSLKYNTIVAQIADRRDIWKLDEALREVYLNRQPKRPLFVYADELNNFFRAEGRRAHHTIVTILTSGGELSVAFLGAAQRPRNISIEAVESMTKCYWFFTPYGEDIKHLKDMGVPSHARSPRNFYQFYFFDRMKSIEGYGQLVLNEEQQKQKQPAETARR